MSDETNIAMPPATAPVSACSLRASGGVIGMVVPPAIMAATWGKQLLLAPAAMPLNYAHKTEPMFVSRNRRP